MTDIATTRNALIEALAAEGATLSAQAQSGLSVSTYLRFDGVPTRLPKSARREFFTRFPKANGASAFGGFSVRISDHNAVSSREASMASVRIDRPLASQIAEVVEMVRFLKARGQ